MKTLTAVLAALSLALLSACSGSAPERQQSADQVFGTAKMSLVVATGLVSVYNVLPPCSAASQPPPLCYSQSIGDVVNRGLAAAASAIESAERIFAASNTDGEARLRAANVAHAVIAELMRNLTQYGFTKLKRTG